MKPWLQAQMEPMPRSLDKRIKYTEKDYEKMRELRKAGWSYNKIADNIGCSKRLAQFVINPERRIENVKVRNRRGTDYNLTITRKRRSEMAKEIRRRKYQLYKQQHETKK